ncbi:MAG: PucR family transcriptional regulator ligand-binding domain-containing protein [Anaerolineae bacterium]|nr:PucR family transcriptional regulator ligand-binding domain-containing protein [Anaerolineae bacterium]
MLTVADALLLNEFAGAQVVGGRAGLQRQIAWVHVVGVPDAAQWLNGGELVLTTANALPSEADEQREYIYALAEKGVTALALAVGRILTHAPEAFREAADALDFPLIEIPYQARFIDIAKTINQRITAAQMENVERALHIHRVLTQLILEGGDLKRLAETLAGLIHQSVSIENERFEALASHNIGIYDEARRYTLSEGRTDPRLVRALEERGVLPEIRARLRPVFIPQMADVGLEMERILAPIVVHGDLYGYIWIIADDRPLSDLDRLAIESGATVAALMIFYQEAVQSAEASLKGGLLTQLIQGEPGREAVLADQSLRYGLDLTAPLVLLVVESGDRSSQRLLQIDRRVNRLAMMQGWHAVIGQFAGHVVILSQASDDSAKLAVAVRDAAQMPGVNVRIAISQSMIGAGQVSTLYAQCQDTLHIANRLGNGQTIIKFDQLGYLYTLLRAGNVALDTNQYVPGVRLLREEQNADLFDTLEVYLDNGGNGMQTAKVLNIHRSTLIYRLDRIKEICAIDLGDPIVRTNLQVAIKLIRLFDQA